MSLFPLDNVQNSLWQQITSQPLPARPDGFFLSPTLYRASLHPLTPITISSVYLLTVLYANARNKAQKGKPKDLINSSPTLKNLVLAHNLLLALYSGWTCVNVFIRLAGYFVEGFQSGGLQGLKCAFCTVPIHEAARDGLLRFVVLFYYSKFYEVVDSLILIGKGKKVSTLQVYHHSGAMLTMWAGVRYSAAPIWIFALWNGFVHSWMYLFYSATSLHVRVPSPLKRGITTMQIAQLFFGMLLASSYLFVHYRPAAFPTHVRPSAGSEQYDGLWEEASQLLFSNSSFSSLLTSPSFQGSSLNTRAIDAKIAASLDAKGQATCLSTSGHAFALLMNVAYLIPLICLFVNFYLQSYIKKKSAASTSSGDSKSKKVQ